ncbi:hypothetical protein [Psychroserpens luteolus]|uniref:hypothetical protein n=1 Tax=Psychroserpens luteolus TaxID=2855840 RepID=UPI001E3589D9|nr:hypothetical protein [Psychroserpens luteolus]MCD2259146.1 hypothetical protein [Psychroserpens luteolus]
MRKSLLLFVFLLVLLNSCKSANIDLDKPKVIKLGNGSVNIDSFKTELIEFDDPKAFHLMISVLSTNGKKYERTIRINHNRPKGNRFINNGNYEYIDYIISAPFFEVTTDKNGELNLYFISEKEFRLIVDHIHYMDIRPIFGKKMILSVYLD